jgi:hypothetical protein
MSQGAGRVNAPRYFPIDQFYWPNRLVALAARYRVPAMYEFREFAAAGGLMSYGTRLMDVYRLQGIYAGKILKGNPAPRSAGLSTG